MKTTTQPKSSGKKHLKFKALNDLTVFLLNELLQDKLWEFREQMDNRISEKFSSLSSVDLQSVLMTKDKVLILEATIRGLGEKIKMIENKVYGK